MGRARAVSRRSLLRGSAAVLAGSVGAATIAACGETEVVEKTVTVTVTEIKEVVKEVPVETIKEIPVERIVIQEIPVEKVVIKEIPVETIREVPVERVVIREVPVERVVIREVPVEKIVTHEVVIEKIVEVAPAPDPTAAVTERPMLAGGRNMEAMGFMPSSFQEAPSLAAKVAAGELPPVEERIPSEPLVWQPFEEIGTYGGRMNFASVAISVDIGNINRTDAVAYNMQGTKLVNDAVKSHEMSSDLTTVIYQLRKGHKWSDGAPFTSKDFVWHYEKRHAERRAVTLGAGSEDCRQSAGRECAGRVGPSRFRTRRRCRFCWTVWVAVGASAGVYVVSHYMEQFHADYNPNAEKEATDDGFENWTQRYQAKKRWGAHQTWFTEHAVDRPVLAPWDADGPLGRPRRA